MKNSRNWLFRDMILPITGVQSPIAYAIPLGFLFFSCQFSTPNYSKLNVASSVQSSCHLAIQWVNVTRWHHTSSALSGISIMIIICSSSSDSTCSSLLFSSLYLQGPHFRKFFGKITKYSNILALMWRGLFERFWSVYRLLEKKSSKKC